MIKLRKKQVAILAVLVLSLATPAGFARADVFSLSDRNSVALIDPSSENTRGMGSWKINGTDILASQWFWFRSDPLNAALIAAGALDTPQNYSLDQIANSGLGSLTATTFLGTRGLDLAYTLPGWFSIDATYLLTGSAGNTADIAETIRITNLSGMELDGFHFIQYSDFDLAFDASGAGADVAQMVNSNTVLQRSTLSGTLSETAATGAFPGSIAPTRWEITSDGGLIDFINANGPYDLANVMDGTFPSNLVGPGDVEWALQWDFGLEAGDSVLISKNKIAQVPEPSMTLLLLGGIGGVALFVRRNFGNRKCLR